MIAIDLGSASGDQPYFGSFGWLDLLAVCESGGMLVTGVDGSGFLRVGEGKKDWVGATVVHEFDDFGRVDEVCIFDNATTAGCCGLRVLNLKRATFTHIINKIPNSFISCSSAFRKNALPEWCCLGVRCNK